MPTSELDALVGRASDVGIIHIADTMIREAILQNASDIHIEPRAEGGVVRYRVDGVLHQAAALPAGILSPLISRVKLMAELDINERRLPRTGSLRMRVGLPEGDVEHHLRVATMPTAHGECLVLRIIPPPALMATWTPERIGLPAEPLARLLSRPQGLILFAGPTGSGKTTVMCAALRQLNSITRKCVMVADDEVRIPGIEMARPSPSGEDAVHALAQYDTDVLVIGEIGAAGEAAAALDAASTGHLVLACMHADDTLAVLDRLAALGVPPLDVAGGLAGVIASRLVRRVCSECKQPHTPRPEHLSALGISREEAAEASFVKGIGCEACRGSGYRGRIGLYEVLESDGALAALLAGGAAGPALRDHLALGGFEVFRRDGARKAREGITSIEEVVRVTGKGAL